MLNLSFNVFYINDLNGTTNAGFGSAHMTANAAPPDITLTLERAHVIANGVDNILVRAYVTDVSGNPVPDGTQLNLAVGTETGCVWNAPSTWTTDDGSLNSFGTESIAGATTTGGYVDFDFGWVPDGNGGNVPYIWAFRADDPTINTKVRVFVEPRTISCSGYLIPYDTTTGVGGIPVTLHVMNGGSEVYSLTRTTSNSMPYPGAFTFDHVVITTGTYWYVTADMTDYKGVAVQGQSDDFSFYDFRTSTCAVVLEDVAFPGPAVTGMVMDSSGNAVSGATVTVHVLDASDSEVGTFPTISASGPVGYLMNFDPGTGTHAYVTADTTIGGNPYHARSNDFTLNGPVTSRADLVLTQTGGPAMTASVASSVMDSFSTAYGGVTATLHVLDGVGTELYTVPGTTSTGAPYVGSVVFDGIDLSTGGVTGYIDCSATITASITIYGSSENFPLSDGQTSHGDVVLRIPMPDEVRLTASPGTILKGGDTAILSAQLYLNGVPYPRANIVVNFASDNDPVAYLPAVKTNITDLTGASAIIMTSSTAPGTVNVNAVTPIMYGVDLTDTVAVDVVNWGTIAGTVTDSTGAGVPNAIVELLSYTNGPGTVDGGSLYPTPENPQMTVSNQRVAQIGTYTFYRIPQGNYMVAAEKDGYLYYSLVSVTDQGTETANIVLPDYVVGTSPPQTTPPASFTTGTGTISGIVTDSSGNGIPYANVGLYNCIYNGGTNTWTNTGPVAGIPNNPQTSNDGLTNTMGAFAFQNVPTGTYMVQADAIGISSYAIVDVADGSTNGNIIWTGTAGGSISGVVTDKNKNGLPNADVTLYTTTYDPITQSWSSDAVVPIADNPQKSIMGITGAVGTFAFEGVPDGTYKVVATMKDAALNDHSYYGIVTIGNNRGTVTADIAIPDFVYFGSSFDPDTIVSMEAGEPSSLDPATAYDTSSCEVVQNVYETLVGYYGNDSMPSNRLAVGADVSADGLTYTIYLRSGVKFQDGTDFNADAVKYSFDRGVIMNQDPWRMMITPHLLGGQEYIDSGDAAQYLAHNTVEVINSTCVQVHLAAPYTGSVFLFSFPATAIISPTYDMANGGYSPNTPSSFMDRHMCGTGPYSFVSWAPGNCVVLAKNNAYWGTPALTQNVIIRYVPDYTARLNAINSGSADLIWASALNTPDLGNPNVVVESGRPTLAVNALCFNLARWRFDDRSIRQAFVESFDDGTYVDSVLNGYGRRVNSPIPQYVDGHDNNIPIYQFNPEHARQLLVDAGFSNSTPTTVNVYYNNGNEPRRIACEQLKKQIESYGLGITVQVTALDWPTYLSRQNAGDMDMYVVGTQADYPSADACLAPYVPNGYYASRIGYVNDSIGALYQQSLSEVEPVKSQLISQIVSGMNADYAYIWLSNAIQFQPYRIELRGYVYNPADTGLRFASMYKDNSVPSYTFNLKQGWNMISLPMYNTMFTASGLGATNPEITDIVMFNQATGEYKIFMVGLSPAAYDFQLLPDYGYFVNCADATTLTIEGKPPSLRSSDLQPGWNLIGWGTYHDIDARSLCEMLDGTQDIVRYNPVTGDYQVYMEGLSTDSYNFKNGPGEGYFINTDSHRTLRYGVI